MKGTFFVNLSPNSCANTLYFYPVEKLRCVVEITLLFIRLRYHRD